MGFFSTKKKIYVSGGISRVRPDELIKRTTGYVVTGALVSDQNISEALTINAISGTVGSYKGFWRKAKKKYGLPTGSFSYYSPNEEQLALTIRTATGNAYPLENDLNSINLSSMDEDFWVKYKLQEAKNYNITTNLLIHNSINYYLDNYLNQTDKFAINIFRTKYTTTTVTKEYEVIYNVGLTKWEVKETTTTDVNWYHIPADTPYSSSSTVITYTDYNVSFDPWGFGTLNTNTIYYPCNKALYEYLCHPVLTELVEVENVSFDLNEPLPPLEEEQLDEQTNDGVTTILVLIEYWQVAYTYSGRQYYWLGLEEDFPIAMGYETDLPDDLEPIFGSWAPIVPIRDNFVSYKSTNPDPSNYKKSKALLKQIGLKIDDLVDAIEQDYTDPDNPVPNPDLNKLADAYVSMHSKLKATFDSVTGKCNNLDELAYNYAFFDLLDQYGFPAYENTYDPETGAMSSRVVSNVALNVYFSGIYNQRIEWSSITKETITESLTEDYVATITPQVINPWGYNTVKYVIKKKLTETTCSVITVSNFSINFTVYSGDYTKGYSPEFDNDPDGESQWVIPVSLTLAKEAVAAKDLETFFLRTTYIGVFSRQVVKIKWYQQSWFQFILIVVSVILMDPQTLIASLSSTGVAVAGAVGITVATGSIIAIAIGLAAYAVISIALKKLLTLALKAVGGNEFLEAIVKIIYVVVNIMISGGKSLFKDIVLGANAFLDTLKTELELATLELKELSLELEKLVKEVDKLTKFENVQAAKEYALEIYNMFANAGEQMTEHDMNKALLLAESPEYLYSSIENAKRLPEPYESYLNADRLVIA